MSNNGYPFISRKQVVERLVSDPAFVIESMRLIDGKWMASHKTRASKVIAKIATGNLSPEDLVEAISLISPYARTISRMLREREMAERPDLMGVAAMFGVVRPAVQAEVATAPVALAPVAPASTEPASVPRKRGRPKGSKDRPKAEEPGSKRRRRS